MSVVTLTLPAFLEAALAAKAAADSDEGPLPASARIHMLGTGLRIAANTGRIAATTTCDTIDGDDMWVGHIPARDLLLAAATFSKMVPAKHRLGWQVTLRTDRTVVTVEMTEPALFADSPPVVFEMAVIDGERPIENLWDAVYGQVGSGEWTADPADVRMLMSTTTSPSVLVYPADRVIRWDGFDVDGGRTGWSGLLLVGAAS